MVAFLLISFSVVVSVYHYPFYSFLFVKTQMSISKSIYELAVIANSLGKVLEGSSKIVQNEAYQWYKSSFVSKTIQDSCDNSQPMYEEMQNISTTIRNQVSLI